MPKSGKASAPSKQTNTRVYSVLIVDDHPVVCRGIRQVLADEQDLSIFGEAANWDTAMRMLKESTPDLAIVDLTLSGGSGLDFIKQARVSHPDVRIVVFSMHDEELYAERCLRAGAQGYVSKEAPAGELLKAIRKVLKGETALSPAMTDRMLNRALTTDAEAPTGMASLSDRELEVYEMIGRGMSTRKIASELVLSVKTIESHRENIKRKLGIKTADELRRHAVAWVETSGESMGESIA